jgi:Fringe-like
MSKYRNGVMTRLGAVSRQLSKGTTTRSRRIILANIVCLILFVGTLFLARRHTVKEVALPGVTPLRTGDVYYVSKRALCSRSLAHEQLGIQPIAVSKVILRPVISVEDDGTYDDRLQVLEEGMVNDVVFLDRNATGKDAELESNLCPLHTIKMLPPRKPPSRYTAWSIAFGVTMQANELPNMLEHWRFWAQKTSTFHIMLPGSEASRVNEVKDRIKRELGIKAVVETSGDSDEPARMSLKLVQSMEKKAGSGKKWFIILTPDTFVVSMDDILLALEPHNSKQVLYMGALSESLGQREKWGHIAYGGAGIVLSRPLASILSKHGIVRLGYGCLTESGRLCRDVRDSLR